MKFIMTALTTEQFKSHFQIKGNTVILSPQVAMIASFCGHTDFDYQLPSKDTTDTSFSQYDTVLIDVLDKDKFPGFYGGVLHSFRFLTYALNFLGGSGTLIGKFPSPLLNKAISFPHSRHLDSKGHTEEIHIFEDHFFVKIVKNASSNKTKVFYENGNEVEVQTKYPILHHYNQEYYDYLRSVDLSTSCPRTTIDGKGDKVAEQLAIRSKRTDFEKVLFVPSNGNKAKAFTFDEVKDKNSGGDAFFAESVEQRDQFIQILQNPKVIDLIKEMCYNNYTSMKLDHKKYIFNELIFNFANS
jgi:hypothetical protein